MRILILLLSLLITGCGGGTINDSQASQAPVSTTAFMQVQAQVKQLQAQISQLQLIGRPTTQSAGRISNDVPLAISFGPCSNMGVVIATGMPNSKFPLTEQIQAFKTCTNYEYAADTITNKLAPPPFAVWDGAGCTGTMYVETDIPGNGYNQQVLTNGVVFSDPLGSSAIFYIPAAAPPKSVFIQSSINTSNPVDTCGVDQETRMVVTAAPNVVTVTGVPNVLPTWNLTGP